MIKWIRILGCILVICLLVSCTPKGERVDKERIAAQISNPFTSGIELQYKDLHAQGNVVKDEEGGFSVDFLSPSSLVDIHFVFVEDRIKISYKDLSFTIHRESAGGSAVISMLVSTINTAIADTGVEVSVENDTVTIQGQVEQGNFLLTLDRETGNFLTLEMPENDFKLEFKHFSFS